MTYEPKTYRKTATVQAMQWDGTTKGTEAILAWANGQVDLPVAESMPPDELIVQTLEGPLAMQVGHWLLQGTEEEFWPNRDDTFTKSYALAENTPSPEGEAAIARDSSLLSWGTHLVENPDA